MLPALPRLSDIWPLIDGKRYFVLHAPRQSGKTTVVRAAARKLNEDGAYYALYCSLDTIRHIPDPDDAIRGLADTIFSELSDSSVENLRRAADENLWNELKASTKFASKPVETGLRDIATRLDKELVVFFDEADTLTGPAMISFLTQLRNGYVKRDELSFPRSIALIGMRNIRDYESQIRPDSETLGSSSPFNIIETVLTLSDFTLDEVKSLYGQHTEATGQLFVAGAIERAWYWSEGQPWLVNALAKEAVANILANDFGRSVTAGHFDEAADNIMRRQETHIDSLMDRLTEPRVRRVLEPMLAADSDEILISSGGKTGASFDDERYCLEIGLVKMRDRLGPANPVYASVITRIINDDIRRKVQPTVAGKWTDGRLADISGLLRDFQEFWARTSELFLKSVKYTEAAPHIALTAYLQASFNGEALSIPEFALGLGRIDLNVRYAGRNYPIELKIRDNQRSKAASRAQLVGYMDRLLANEGWLVVFDRNPDKSWTKKIGWETVTEPTGQIIHVVGC